MKKNNDEGALRWLDSVEVMEALKISYNTLLTFVHTGKLPASRLGRKLYFRADDIDLVLRRNMVLPSGRMDLSDYYAEQRQKASPAPFTPHADDEERNHK